MVSLNRSSDVARSVRSLAWAQRRTPCPDRNQTSFPHVSEDCAQQLRAYFGGEHSETMAVTTPKRHGIARLAIMFLLAPLLFGSLAGCGMIPDGPYMAPVSTIGSSYAAPPSQEVLDDDDYSHIVYRGGRDPATGKAYVQIP